METVLYYALAASGLGVMCWQHLRRLRAVRDAWAEDAEIALHVAAHEAHTRKRASAPVDLFYGLLQDDAVIATIRRTGGDAAAIEDATITALPDGGAHDDAQRALAWALHLAADAGRLATCEDLLRGLLIASPGIARLIAAGGVSTADLLFTLVHGVAEREVELPAGERIELVLCNDDVTPQVVVVDILQQVFAMDEERAVRHMLEAHTGGRGVLGVFARGEAARKLDAARAAARRRGCPLWIRPQAA